MLLLRARPALVAILLLPWAAWPAAAGATTLAVDPARWEAGVTSVVEARVVSIEFAYEVHGLPIVRVRIDDAVLVAGEPPPDEFVTLAPHSVEGAAALRTGERYRLRLVRDETSADRWGLLGLAAGVVPLDHGDAQVAAPDSPEWPWNSQLLRQFLPLTRADDGGPCTWSPADGGTVPVALGPHAATGLTDTELLAALDEAARMWSAIDCSRFRFDVSVAPLSTLVTGDGIVGIEFIGEGWTAELGGRPVLALTAPACDAATGEVTDADVIVNAQHYAWSTDASGSAPDVRGAIAHELGHVLGLGHSIDPASTMYPSVSIDRILRYRALGADDVAGACALYDCDTAETCAVPFPDPNPFVPPGSGLCARCDSDADCGGLMDLCVDSVDAAPSRCGRSCSDSFPCPEGFACMPLTLGDGSQSSQCIPSATCDGRPEEACPACRSGGACDEGYLCTAPDGSGGWRLQTLDPTPGGGSRCAIRCDGGLSCPADFQCQAFVDANGVLLSELCVSDSADCPPEPAPITPGCCPERKQGGSHFLPAATSAALVMAGRRRLAGTRRQ